MSGVGGSGGNLGLFLFASRCASIMMICSSGEGTGPVTGAAVGGVRIVRKGSSTFAPPLFNATELAAGAALLLLP